MCPEPLHGPRLSPPRPKLWRRHGRGYPEVDQIRDVMLRQLPAGEGDLPIAERLRTADDLLALWYLRAELYEVLTQMEGEELASEKLEPVTHHFAGLIPQPLRPRATHLGGPVAANVEEYLLRSEED